MARIHKTGFTLIELLVVVTIIVVLLALLMPAMDRAMEMSIRAVCASRIHTFIAASLTYASNSKAYLPSGKRNGYGDYSDSQSQSYDGRTEHVVWVPSQVMRVAKEYGGSDVKGRGQTNPLLTCPNFTPEFGGYDGGDPNNALAPKKRDNYVIGYGWLGGLPGVSGHNENTDNYPALNQGGPGNYWRSQRRLTDPINDLMADHNAWAVGDTWMFVAHTPGGPLGGPHPTDPNANYFNYGKGGPAAHPDQAPSDGGNVGRGDGGVHWKRLDQMHVFESSWPWFGYPAMW